MEDTFERNGEMPSGESPKTNKPQGNLRMPAPNANLILAFGIVSIVTCCCCSGILGIIFAIIAIILAVKSKKEFTSNSDLYDENTFGKVNAGKTCAIIGLIVGILMFTIAIIVISVSLSDGASIIDSVGGWDQMGY
jgi:ABC-type phosphate transport system permease subunit